MMTSEMSVFVGWIMRDPGAGYPATFDLRKFPAVRTPLCMQFVGRLCLS
jgi:hypothetical protein